MCRGSNVIEVLSGLCRGLVCVAKCFAMLCEFESLEEQYIEEGK